MEAPEPPKPKERKPRKKKETPTEEPKFKVITGTFTVEFK